MACVANRDSPLPKQVRDDFRLRYFAFQHDTNMFRKTKKHDFDIGPRSENQNISRKYNFYFFCTWPRQTFFDFIILRSDMLQICLERLENTSLLLGQVMKIKVEAGNTIFTG